MERGELVGKLRARFGERLGLYKGIATIDTNGDTAEIFYNEDVQRFQVEAVISEQGFGRGVLYQFLTLDEAMDAIDRLIAIEGQMPSKAEADAVVAATETPIMVATVASSEPVEEVA